MVNILAKLQNNQIGICEFMLLTRECRQTDGQTDRQTDGDNKTQPN